MPLLLLNSVINYFSSYINWFGLGVCTGIDKENYIPWSVLESTNMEPSNLLVMSLIFAKLNFNLSRSLQVAKLGQKRSSLISFFAN